MPANSGSPRPAFVDVENADLRLGYLADMTAQGGSQKLMTQTDAEIWHAPIHDRFADGPLLGHQPGIQIFLPDIRGPAHDPKLVVTVKRRDCFALVELDGIPSHAVLGQEIAEDARMFDGDMLKYKDAHGGQIATLAWIRSRESEEDQFQTAIPLSARRPSDCSAPRASARGNSCRPAIWRDTRCRPGLPSGRRPRRDRISRPGIAGR